MHTSTPMNAIPSRQSPFRRYRQKPTAVAAPTAAISQNHPMYVPRKQAPTPTASTDWYAPLESCEVPMVSTNVEKWSRMNAEKLTTPRSGRGAAFESAPPFLSSSDQAGLTVGA